MKKKKKSTDVFRNRCQTTKPRRTAAEDRNIVRAENKKAEITVSNITNNF